MIKKNLFSSTWHNMETKGRFTKNHKLTFISDDMLILGCDVGSETHYVRAIDIRGRELSTLAFSFSNNLEGFEAVKEWAMKTIAAYGTGFSGLSIIRIAECYPVGGGIPWNDPDINIDWPKINCEYKISEKDEKHESFKDQSFAWAEKWL